MNHRYRLGYHIMAPANWINDPNGLIQYKGEYHVFYQHHPFDENWGPMHWGHVKSKDLVHWEHLPIALTPTEDYEKDGCFSGSAVDDNGVLTLIYTGNIFVDREKDIVDQSQCIATSVDGIHFTKEAANPVISKHPEEGSGHFRDPKVWRHGEYWYMVLGTRKGNTGKVILYKSKDLRQWEYLGVLAESDETLGYMWECPDFFELDGKYVLMFSPQGMEAKGDLYNNLFQTGYLIGEYDYETNKFIHGSFTELDHGHDFYAVQTLLDDKGRRIAIGWMDMWESNMPTKEDGWCGALTLPRELTLGENNEILMNPVEELTFLRELKNSVCTDKSISGTHLVETKEDLIELKLEFDLTKTAAESVGLKIRGINQEETTLLYQIENQKLTLDCTKSGKGEDGVRRTKVESNQVLSLRVFIDRSSIEVFVNDGQATLTSRIYPKEERLGIELFTENGDAHVIDFTYWKLKDIWR
ncbi:glycoside hydrolase family 32 protein [Heyndrickxia sporothermodurans]|uniref:glycoside hydrolase family 32 protein n=1 Tax=Heyndrickxia sporothermodurans TaxID=46224 RepID=UPI002DBC6A89|nr:glycoside hydrolase family 32 protein [Heyndrickxia sporothermodurans]MEB6549790.1 glycoside hydrolase family 32 protein [Heyndrickxia sporothermodurans]MED3652446.1 glycoside hydrolase family 32 protein [Heyndrickxia sporothermodurans]MED3655961.1 glycoside hydrolase family 32 protein [Heyndrickxia sporothermodurans]MED3696797.1 glycoside hydrolase family 32 protein [Heyndrickxia sporothermodurans]MED3780660.1 glycoside hydrolase family 32 protein [Heyndrickxia sporothermodurans]